VLARVESLGATVEVLGDKLRVVSPRGALLQGDLSALAASKTEVLALLRDRGLDRFLADSSIPLAVFRSRTLGRDFVLARDAAALAALTERDRGLPVLTFADCDKLAGVSLSALRMVLDVRAEFGPSASLEVVRPHVG
jgi:hypothetical protein